MTGVTAVMTGLEKCRFALLQYMLASSQQLHLACKRTHVCALNSSSDIFLPHGCNFVHNSVLERKIDQIRSKTIW